MSNQDINFFQQQDMLIRFRNMLLRLSFAASSCRINIWHLTWGWEIPCFNYIWHALCRAHKIYLISLFCYVYFCPFYPNSIASFFYVTSLYGCCFHYLKYIWNEFELGYFSIKEKFLCCQEAPKSKVIIILCLTVCWRPVNCWSVFDKIGNVIGRWCPRILWFDGTRGRRCWFNQTKKMPK